MAPTILGAVRGTRDVLNHEARVQAAVTADLATVLDHAGYDPIDVPVLEHRALYLKKAGDELLTKLYHWNQGGRDLALRPEWTVSVLRAVLAGLSDTPKPLRLRYAGPVFRYERPSKGRYRQFTQLGLELIGATGAHADAEVLGLAVAGLHAVGIHDFTVTIGQIGIIKALFGALGLAERTVSALTWSLERVRIHGIDAVREHFETSDIDLPLDWSMLRHLSDADIEALLLNVLPGLGVRLDGSGRDPQTIVHRLVRKLRHTAPADQLERAWRLLVDLNAARGAPEATLQHIEQLLSQFHVETSAVDELRTTLGLLAAYGVPLERVQLDFGMGRGLHYYTGMIFEIDGSDGLQLCGGGRYDDFIASLGGPSMPAVGCAYGLERVIAAAPPLEITTPPSALVCGNNPEAVIQATHYLRAKGFRALLDVRERSFSNNLNDARRRGLEYIVVVDGSTLRLKHLETGAEHTEDVDATTQPPHPN